jgi:hypothetical protein
MKIIIYALMLMLLTGCGATMKSQLLLKDVRLGDYRSVHLKIATAGGSLSFSGANLGSGFATANSTPYGVSASGIGTTLSSSHAMTGNDQIIMAAQDIEFALRELGFETVDSPDKADIVALFSIGTVRYDPLAGWIADRAFLQFKESASGSLVVSIKADGQLITPTVSTLVDNIVSEVEKYR